LSWSSSKYLEVPAWRGRLCHVPTTAGRLKGGEPVLLACFWPWCLPRSGWIRVSRAEVLHSRPPKSPSLPLLPSDGTLAPPLVRTPVPPSGARASADPCSPAWPSWDPLCEAWPWPVVRGPPAVQKWAAVVGCGLSRLSSQGPSRFLPLNPQTTRNKSDRDRRATPPSIHADRASPPPPSPSPPPSPGPFLARDPAGAPRRRLRRGVS